MTHPVRLTAPQLEILAAEHLIIVDLELTCGPGVSEDVQDIIEVGTCLLAKGVPVQEKDSHSLLVRPVRSRVTSFCTRLTGIRPQDVAGEPTFSEVASEVWWRAEDSQATAWASWGGDHDLLERQCAAIDVPNPLASLPHYDLRRLMTPVIYSLSGGSRPQGSGAGVGLAAAMAEVGLSFVGQPHSGRYDALNTARLLQRVRNMIDMLSAGPDANDCWRTTMRAAL